MFGGEAFGAQAFGSTDDGLSTMLGKEVPGVEIGAVCPQTTPVAGQTIEEVCDC